MADILTFEARDAATIRDDALRFLKSALLRRGIPAPQVGPGSEYYVRFQAFANEAEVVEANAVVKCDELMDDTATGDALVRRCEPYGIIPRPAGGSVGAVVFSTSAPSLVAANRELIDTLGQRYRVVEGGVFEDGWPIQIAAISTGDTTNLEPGSVLKWVGASPAYSAPTVVVGDAGLRNGRSADTEEDLRARLYSRKRSPPATENPSHLTEIATSPDLPQVQYAFVYPAVEGPATWHMAVTASATSTNKSRDVDATVLESKVVPYILGKTSPGTWRVITTVLNQPCDIAFGISVPDALAASPPGDGTGWVDASPWPVAGLTGSGAKVVSATSTTKFVVDATTAPTIGVSTVSWLSPIEWKLYTATVVGSSASGPNYEITIDNPFVGVATGHMVWPSLVNAQTYIDALLAFFNTMGPGEKTASVSALVRSFRHPRPRSSWPYALGRSMTQAVKVSSPEIMDVQFISRFDNHATTLGNSGEVTPKYPGSIPAAPNVFVPRNIGFYQLT